MMQLSEMFSLLNFLMQRKNVPTLPDVSPIKQPLLAELKPTSAERSSAAEPCASSDIEKPQAASDKSLVYSDITSTEPISIMKPRNLSNMEQSPAASHQPVADIEQPAADSEPSAIKPVSVVVSTVEPFTSNNTEQPQSVLDKSLADIDMTSTELALTMELNPSSNMAQAEALSDQSAANVKTNLTELDSIMEPCLSANMQQPQALSNQSSADVEPSSTEQASNVQPMICMAQASSTSSLMENHLDEMQSANQRRGRKRVRSIDSWKKSLRKKHRNCGDEYVTDRGITKARRKMKKGCGIGCRLHCHDKLSPTDREKIFHAFWQLGEVTRQREFIVKHCSKVAVSSRKIAGCSRRKFSIRYAFGDVGVCKQFFLDTLNINDRVIRTAFHKLTEFGTVKGDSRGAVTGRSKICSTAKQHVVDHINQFPRVESHYCRASSSRQYLEAGLSLSQMYRLYVNEMAKVGKTSVKEHMYRKIFNENFNLSFFTPKKDQCDTCFAYANSSESVRSENENEFHSHIERKEKARQTKNEMKCRAMQDVTMTAACFDLQQVLPSPHGQISVYYYKRKLSTYNFTCYNLGTGSANCFMWNESYAGRGSNEINSCLYHYLKLNSEKQFVCTFSDNCAGQNKSRYTVVTFLKALAETKIEAIEHYYLEKGHTQNENDSVHSTIERAARKIPVYTPDQWCSVVRTARKNGQPYIVHEMVPGSFSDFKCLTKSFRNFSINTRGEKVNWLKICRLKFTKSQLHTVLYAYSYSGDYMQLDLLQKHRGMKPDIKVIKLAALPSSSRITRSKYNDLMSLCQHSLIPEQYHSFYRNLIYDATIADADDDADADAD